MADRDAKVRLNLAANGFLSTLQQLQSAAKDFEHAVEGVGDGGEKASRKLGAFGTAAKAGFGAAKASLAELGKGLKSTLGQVATLGGALSAANAVRGAVEMTEGYKNLAFAIHSGTGVSMTWQQVQTQVEGAAQRTKRSNREMLETWTSLHEAIGDVKFAAVAMESVAKASNVTGKSMQVMGGIAAGLREKFGIGAEGMDAALAAAISLSERGGVTLDDLSGKIDIIGASAKQMGFDGLAGFQQVMGMMNVGDDVLGGVKRNVQAVTTLMETFADPDKVKDIEKELHIKISDHAGVPFKDALDRIIEKSGGKEEILGKVFSGQEVKLVSEFGRTYTQAYEATTGDMKTKMRAGIDAVHAALEAGGKSFLSKADFEKEAAARTQDASRNFQAALNKLEAAFSDEKMIGAINDIAKNLPALAKAIADMLGWAINHPKTAAAAVVAGKVGGAVLPAVAGSLLPAAWKAIVARVGGAAAATAATSTGAGGVMTLGGGSAAAVGAGTAAAGLLAAGAIGGGIGYGIVRATVDPRLHDKNADLQFLNDATIEGKLAMGGTRERKQSAADALREQIKTSRKTRTLFGGALDDVFGAGAQLVDKSYRDPNKVAVGKAQEQLRSLEQSLGKGSATGDRASQSFARLAESADRVTAVLNKFGGGAGSNGLPPTPGNEPGSTPR
ncbi:MAG: hypothetical protein WDO69_25125 [Pseudomonadota bacterium]